ncbi:MAG: MFS transporter [Desulfuromonadales bacterium]
MTKRAPLWLAWLMWGLVANLYLIGFFQRVAPAVMVDELMRDFSLDGALVGNLSATYFYAYALMQIPTGLLADAIGPRRLSGWAMLIAGIGTLIFALSFNLWMAYAGRFLIGASVGVAFVACMKLAGHWFPSNRFATVTGVALLLGNLGGVVAGLPLAEAVAAFGWRSSMIASALVTFAGAVAIWVVVRDDPRERGYKSHAPASVVDKGSLPAGKALKTVMKKRETWLLFLAGGLSAAPVLVFAGLWGVPYLTQVYGLDRSQAAILTSTMLIAWAVGGPSLGAISDRLGRRKPTYLVANSLMACLWGVFLVFELPKTLLYPLFAAIGFTSGGLIIGFAFSREANHPGAAGAVGGLVNMAVVGIAAILQPVLGGILDRNWDGTLVAGTRIYDSGAYQAAFFWLFFCALFSVLAVAFTRETFCRPRDEETTRSRASQDIQNTPD